jgi:electron transport complex protein RnfA
MSAPLHLAVLAVFSGLSMNLLLQCGLGMRGAAREGERPFLLVRIGLVFLSVLILWTFFSYVFHPGFFEYLLLFPLSALIYAGLERLLFRAVLKQEAPGFKESYCCDGLTAAALFLTLHLASGFVEAAVLSLGFSLGLLISLLILAEVRRRSRMEAVPRLLRGSPLALISMGLLALIFSSTAFIFYQALGG